MKIRDDMRVRISYERGAYWTLSADLRSVVDGPFKTIAEARIAAPDAISEGVNIYLGRDAEFTRRMQ